MAAGATRKTLGRFWNHAATLIVGVALTIGLALIVAPLSVFAQGRPANAQADGPDGPQRRSAVRFITESENPPFNYIDEDGALSGFNVDLARTICLELAATCDIQVKPWDDLIPVVRRGDADAVIASHVASPTLLRDVSVSDRYYFTPARFVGLVETAVPEATPTGLARKKIAVARGTSHEAYLRAFFRLSEIQAYDNPELARDAVRSKTADVLFDDGIGLVFWLKGEASKVCCEFKGGPFTEPHYFGDGVGVLIRREDPALRLQINAALKRLRETGRLQELMLRYFPIQPY